MIGWALAAGLALGAETACPDLQDPGDDVAIAWVAPVGKRVGNKGWVDAVRTADLRAWAASQGTPTVGGLLRHLGLRRRASEPRKRYVVVVFDVAGDVPCRPIPEETALAGTVLGGLPACDKPGPVASDGDGCGRVTSADGRRGPEVLRLRWRDAAARGFCVIPADRFLAGS